ncbi:large ribosomal subunit protein bL21c [Cornus florida]|uniref:large ribosomal subunit protein bL21c n=1 Tax=Cornus florida TaxID=4283 RepID=UPI0028A0DA19|nr:large ribosomal subunit protein bL21c [Cornus florida]
MASSMSLSFCSLTTIPSHKQTTLLSVSKPNLSFLSPIPSLSSLRLDPSFPRKSTLSIVPKFSETEIAVVESEPEPAISEPSEVVETKNEEPKREEVFAVVMIGSRQYIVFPGRFIYTQRLKGANVNDKIILNKVLLVGTKTSTYIGKPVVPNAAVHAVVEEQGLDDKVIVFKYKRKKKYRRNIGHRQPNSRIRIMGITGYQDSPAVTLT